MALWPLNIKETQADMERGMMGEAVAKVRQAR